MNKEEIKFDLNEDILYQIGMLSYIECNDKLCEINDHLGDIYSYRDKEDAERYELEYEKRLLEIAVKQLQQELTEWKEDAGHLLDIIKKEKPKMTSDEFYAVTIINDKLNGGVDND